MTPMYQLYTVCYPCTSCWTFLEITWWYFHSSYPVRRWQQKNSNKEGRGNASLAEPALQSALQSAQPQAGSLELSFPEYSRAITESWISASDKDRFRRLPLYSQYQIIYKGERDVDKDTYRETWDRETDRQTNRSSRVQSQAGRWGDDRGLKITISTVQTQESWSLYITQVMGNPLSLGSVYYR